MSESQIWISSTSTADPCDVIRQRPPLPRAKKIDFHNHNQLLDGLTHLHAFRLSHGGLSFLNIQVTYSSDTVKLLNFGRFVFTDSVFLPSTDELADPFQHLDRKPVSSPSSKIHPKMVFSTFEWRTSLPLATPTPIALSTSDTCKNAQGTQVRPSIYRRTR